MLTQQLLATSSSHPDSGPGLDIRNSRFDYQWKKVEVKISDKIRRRLPVDATEDVGAMEGWVCRDPKKEFQEVLQHDMWGVEPSDRWDWDALRAIIANNGLRNSLLVAPMPTASTSQILGNNECFEPYTSNIYTRRWEFVVVNKHLLHDLTEMGICSPALKNRMIHEEGSVQKIPEIPEWLK
ncbi:ribonucleotide-diphosphate reductase subunit rnr1 [Orobanche hederae]